MSGIAGLERDLDEIVEAAADDLRHFAGARLYVTGGTGFFGTWLLRAVLHANRRLGTRIRADVLTRDPIAFARNTPDVAGDGMIRLVRGDARAPVADGRYDGVIHAATPSGTTLPPAEMLAVIIDGTRAVVRDVVAPSGSIPVLFTSSGAVYGQQPPDLWRLPESYSGAPDQLQPRFAYHEGKRVAELILSDAQSCGAGRLRLARLFAFIGPGLPLDAHYAAGNFLRDALAGGPIAVAGDGTPFRSYLYPSDLIVWCLAIFARGTDSRAYNVGSGEPVSIRELAERVARRAGRGIEVTVAQSALPGVLADRYVPDPTRIVTELGVRQSVDLDTAIERTLAHCRTALSRR